METFFLSEETFFLLLFLETLDLALVKGSMQHCHQSMQVFHEKFSCSMNLHIHILSLVTVSFFTLLLPPIHPSIHQYIHTTIRPRTETQVQLYCPVHGEHAVKAFSPSLLLLASCLHILTPLCVVPTLWFFFFSSFNPWRLGDVHKAFFLQAVNVTETFNGNDAVMHSQWVILWQNHRSWEINMSIDGQRKSNFTVRQKSKLCHCAVHCPENNPDIILKT